MLTGIHFLLSYTCNMTCDHCFLYCSPTSNGTMTLEQIKEILKESKKIGTIEETYFEGGEPFLFYPLMLEGIKLSHELGFKSGIVSNGYWSTNPEDAQLWLKPLSDLNISNLSVSDDDLHFGDYEDSPARIASKTAKALGIPTISIKKEKPEVQPDIGDGKGMPEISGGIKLRGRAVEKFADGLPTKKCKEFIDCPYEDLVDPKRVHIDSYGNVQICQGISIGNCWEKPLSKLIHEYDPQKHPICGPLVRGGPFRLVEEHGLRMKDEYVDECHLCYEARLALLDIFPEYLAPKQVYGIN
ncbi:MAG: radical SAM protein [Candidatus Marinimicrobia bacterium]|nr:radical SAM protein [Candidatus Neomarinimicrobiota bacterium]